MPGLGWFLWALLAWQAWVPWWQPQYEVSYNADMPYEAQTIPLTPGNCRIELNPNNWPLATEHARRVVALHEMGHCLGIYRHLEQWSVMRGTDNLDYLTGSDVEAALALPRAALSYQNAALTHRHVLANLAVD